MNANKKILSTIMTLAFAAVCLCANGCGESDQESSLSPESADSQAGQKEPSPAVQGWLTSDEPTPAEPKTPEEKTAPTEKIVETAKPKPTKIEWLHSVSEGLDLAKNTGKPALIDFYADWCPPCQQMDKNTFPDKRVIEELARFVAIKADLTRPSSPGQPAAAEYGVQNIPTYIFIDIQGKQTKLVGYQSPDRFLQILKGIK